MKYLIEGIVVAVIMIAGLHYFAKQPWEQSIWIGVGGAILTVLNKIFLDRKQRKKQS
ncbi:hypothetical protein QW060_22435 [Myroides ceti]|uniref:Uncharacterized protein n=1 Tax=Paenimyroides ceti TaxID=395087 RepID=A0ABT8CZQ3_9FLAO|nr:hypothetical protein [Paenimyroides ceti]MDN3709709.1 hypothetical protein [Paenimyroides ceti]